MSAVKYFILTVISGSHSWELRRQLATHTAQLQIMGMYQERLIPALLADSIKTKNII